MLKIETHFVICNMDNFLFPISVMVIVSVVILYVIFKDWTNKVLAKRIFKDKRIIQYMRTILVVHYV